MGSATFCGCGAGHFWGSCCNVCIKDVYIHTVYNFYIYIYIQLIYIVYMHLYMYLLYIYISSIDVHSKHACRSKGLES